MNIQRLLFRIIRGANHDLCPWCRGLTDWLKEPLGWVVSAIAFSVLVGLFVGPQGYILASGFLVLLLLGLCWPWLSMKAVRCQLLMPDRRVEENQDIEVVFRVRNFWPLPIFGMMVKGEFLQADGEDEAVAFLLKRVGAWSESEFRLPLTPRQRGRLPTGEVFVSSGFPFGLMDFDKRVDVPEPTLVWPTCVALDGFPVSDSTRFCLEGALRDIAGNDGDCIGVRSWQPGDSLKNIHWPQSARSQKLMVRERQSISSTGVTVLMDLTPEHHGGTGKHSSFEWTIRIAASICAHLHETHSPVRIVCAGLPVESGRKVPTCEDNRNGLRPLMDFLAGLPTHAGALQSTSRLDASEAARIHHRNVAMANAGSASGHLFIVGSDRSTQVQLLGSRSPAANVTPVVIDKKRFTNADRLPLDGGATAPMNFKEARHQQNALVPVDTPGLAVDQFSSGWDRRFNHVV